MEKTEKQLQMEHQLAEWRAKRAAKMGSQPLAPISNIMNKSCTTALRQSLTKAIDASSSVSASNAPTSIAVSAADAKQNAAPAVRPKHQMDTKASQNKLRHSASNSSGSSRQTGRRSNNSSQVSLH